MSADRRGWDVVAIRGGFAHHDYRSDPFSKGDPLGFRPGRLSKSHSAMAAAEGAWHLRASARRQS